MTDVAIPLCCRPALIDALVAGGGILAPDHPLRDVLLNRQTGSGECVSVIDLPKDSLPPLPGMDPKTNRRHYLVGLRLFVLEIIVGMSLQVRRRDGTEQLRLALSQNLDEMEVYWRDGNSGVVALTTLSRANPYRKDLRLVARQIEETEAVRYEAWILFGRRSREGVVPEFSCLREAIVFAGFFRIFMAAIGEGLIAKLSQQLFSRRKQLKEAFLVLGSADDTQRRETKMLSWNIANFSHSGNFTPLRSWTHEDKHRTRDPLPVDDSPIKWRAWGDEIMEWAPLSALELHSSVRRFLPHDSPFVSKVILNNERGSDSDSDTSCTGSLVELDNLQPSGATFDKDDVPLVSKTNIYSSISNRPKVPDLHDFKVNTELEIGLPSIPDAVDLGGNPLPKIQSRRGSVDIPVFHLAPVELSFDMEGIRNEHAEKLARQSSWVSSMSIESEVRERPINAAGWDHLGGQQIEAFSAASMSNSSRLTRKRRVRKRKQHRSAIRGILKKEGSFSSRGSNMNGRSVSFTEGTVDSSHWNEFPAKPKRLPKNRNKKKK